MDVLSKEECQEIIDRDHIWKATHVIKKRGGELKFNEAPIDLWRTRCPDINILHEIVLKYEIGDFSTRHIDSQWRHINPNYHAAAVWITPLNDGYEGGELYFNDDLVEQVIGVPVKYRTKEPHEITEVIKGTRYSLVSWIFVPNNL